MLSVALLDFFYNLEKIHNNGQYYVWTFFVLYCETRTRGDTNRIANEIAC
jgi:hypothetical protein